MGGRCAPCACMATAGCTQAAHEEDLALLLPPWSLLTRTGPWRCPPTPPCQRRRGWARSSSGARRSRGVWRSPRTEGPGGGGCRACAAPPRPMHHAPDANGPAAIAGRHDFCLVTFNLIFTCRGVAAGEGRRSRAWTGPQNGDAYPRQRRQSLKA
ncbi:MAG: hypothetical protein J3K34DRAFT_264612 [Monoraphidium minutum]|nr:MAG: hypothetical protein J3K34DRAFT_264612 [Monoraphidium minutum]